MSASRQLANDVSITPEAQTCLAGNAPKPRQRCAAPLGNSNSGSNEQAKTDSFSETSVEPRQGTLQRIEANPSPSVHHTPLNSLSGLQDSNLGHAIVSVSADPFADAERHQQSFELMDSVVPRTSDLDRAGLAAANRLTGIAPRDSVERMLATQMLALHAATMDCARRAALAQSSELRNEHLKLASKTSGAFAQLVETFDKRRRGGKQKVTVEHVHVHPGGQAIVGNVTGGSTGGALKNAE